MTEADWVLVPSTWWENAPLVILEAFRHRRPVICTGVGGMAELVADNVTGLHAPRADPRGWAATMARAITEPGLFDKLAMRIDAPRDTAMLAAEHLALYRALLAARPRAAA
jgi:glycosyltransferase involved in cell wall biosynthesis